MHMRNALCMWASWLLLLYEHKFSLDFGLLQHASCDLQATVDELTTCQCNRDAGIWIRSFYHHQIRWCHTYGLADVLELIRQS